MLRSFVRTCNALLSCALLTLGYALVALPWLLDGVATPELLVSCGAIAVATVVVAVVYRLAVPRVELGGVALVIFWTALLSTGGLGHLLAGTPLERALLFGGNVVWLTPVVLLSVLEMLRPVR